MFAKESLALVVVAEGETRLVGQCQMARRKSGRIEAFHYFAYELLSHDGKTLRQLAEMVFFQT